MKPDYLRLGRFDTWDSESWESLEPPDLSDWWPEATEGR